MRPLKVLCDEETNPLDELAFKENQISINTLKENYCCNSATFMTHNDGQFLAVPIKVELSNTIHENKIGVKQHKRETDKVPLK